MDNILFRNLREEENIEDGLWAADLNSTSNTCYHVGHGNKGKSEWVSTSVSVSILIKYMLLNEKFSRLVVIDEDQLDMSAEDCRNRKDWEYYNEKENTIDIMPAMRYGNASQEKCVLYYIPPAAVECVLISEKEMLRIQEPLTDEDRKTLADAAEMLRGKNKFNGSPFRMAVMADKFRAEYGKNKEGQFNFGTITLNRFTRFEFSTECNYSGSNVEKKEAARRFAGYKRNDGSYFFGNIGEIAGLLDKAVIEYIKAGDYESARRIFFAAAKSMNIMLEVAKDDLGLGAKETENFKIPTVEPEKIRNIEVAKNDNEGFVKEAREYFARLSRGAKESNRYEMIASDNSIAVWGEAKVVNMLRKTYGGGLHDNGYMWTGEAKPEEVKQLIEDGIQAEQWLRDAAMKSVFNKSPEAAEEYKAMKELHDDYFQIERKREMGRINITRSG